VFPVQIFDALAAAVAFEGLSSTVTTTEADALPQELEAVIV